MLGVCLDAMNDTARPEPYLLDGFDLVRLVAFTDPQYYEYVARLQWAGKKVVAVLAAETFDGRDYAAVCNELCQLTKPDYWVIGNEQDAGWLSTPSPSSWKLEPEEYAQLWIACEGAIRQCYPSTSLLIGGFVAGQPGVYALYVQAIKAWSSTARIDGTDIHPYGKGPVDARLLLNQYKSVYPMLPLYVLEWNRPSNQIKPFATMLDGATDGHTWFCWSDGQVPGMGLVNEDGDPNPEYSALTGNIELPNGETTDMSIPFVLGFAAYAEQHPEVGYGVEEEWTERTEPHIVRRQDTNTGTLRYYQQSNEIVFSPLPKV